MTRKKQLVTQTRALHKAWDKMHDAQENLKLAHLSNDREQLRQGFDELNNATELLRSAIADLFTVLIFDIQMLREILDNNEETRKHNQS